MNESPVATATGWRNALSIAAETLSQTLGNLPTTDLEDIGDALSTVESEMDDVVNAIPCESGLIEFVEELERGGEDVHDECYSYEDVALTYDDIGTKNSWRDEVEETHHLVRFGDMADTLEMILEGTRIRWTKRAITGMITQLRADEFTSGNDLADYLDDNEEVTV